MYKELKENKKSMRLPSRPKRSKKLLLIAGAVLLLIAIAGIGYYISTMDERRRQSVSNGPPSYDQESGNKQAADGTPLYENENKPTTDPGTTTTPPANTPTAKTTVTPTINSANNQGGTIVARATITGVSNLKGQCAFIFTKGELKKEVITTIGYVNGYYACADGKIPASEFGSGTVKIQVEIRDDQFAGTSAPWELQL